MEFRAYQDYVQRASQKRKQTDRTVFGDRLHGHRPADYPLDPDALVYGGFGSVLQGDHLGVEFGIAAHVGLFQSVGPLPEKGCLTMGALVRPASSYQGLVIDDFFSIAPVPVSQLKEGDNVAASAAKQDFDIAKKCYKQEGLAGSGRKDVIDQAVATVVGAEIDSRHSHVSAGVLPVGAPAYKRLSLSWVAAQACRFGQTTDALHASLLGGLTSAFCYRRCGMSVLNKLYKVIPSNDILL